MNIVHNLTFKNELKSILAYIAKDKSSFYFNDKNIRDMTFKGYTVVYEVNFEKDCIEILKIFNRNKP